jgi:ankyrin repeat protein
MNLIFGGASSCYNDDISYYKATFTYCSNINDNILLYSVTNNYYYVTNILLMVGYSPNIILKNAHDRIHRTAIETAIHNDNLPMVKLLFEYGAIDMTTSGDKYNPPSKNLLHEASIAGSVEIIEYLITEKEYDPNKLGDYTVPLGYAASNNHYNATKKLLEFKADVKADKYVLHHGCNSMPILILLVENGAEINYFDGFDKETVLMRVSNSCLEEQIKYLVAINAKTNFLDTLGKTALDYYKQKCEVKPEIIELLTPKSALETVNKYSSHLTNMREIMAGTAKVLSFNTLLHWSIKNKDFEKAITLANKCSYDMIRRDEDGKIPIEYCLNNDCPPKLYGLINKCVFSGELDV